MIRHISKDLGGRHSHPLLVGGYIGSVYLADNLTLSVKTASAHTLYSSSYSSAIYPTYVPAQMGNIYVLLQNHSKRKQPKRSIERISYDTTLQ